MRLLTHSLTHLLACLLVDNPSCDPNGIENHCCVGLSCSDAKGNGDYRCHGTFINSQGEDGVTVEQTEPAGNMTNSSNADDSNTVDHVASETGGFGGFGGFDNSKSFMPEGVKSDCLKVGADGSFPACDPEENKCCSGLTCIPAKAQGKKSSKQKYACGNAIEELYSPANAASFASSLEDSDVKGNDKKAAPQEEATGLAGNLRKPPSKKEQSYERWYMVASALIMLCLVVNLYSCSRQFEYTRI